MNGTVLMDVQRKWYWSAVNFGLRSVLAIQDL